MPLTAAHALRALLDAFVLADRAAAQDALVDLTVALVNGPLPRVELRWSAPVVAEVGRRLAHYTIVSDSAVKAVDTP